jgi:hypothetical protein
MPKYHTDEQCTTKLRAIVKLGEDVISQWDNNMPLTKKVQDEFLKRNKIEDMVVMAKELMNEFK